MTKVLKGVTNYLENLGIVFDDITVSKSPVASTNVYNYSPDYLYLDQLSIDNTLALTILATQFGATNKKFSLERTLTSLEEQLLSDMSKEIVYILEKEVDSYFQGSSGAETVEDYSLVILQGENRQMISFAFMRESKIDTARESGATSGTKVEAILGTIATKIVKPNQIYKVHSFNKERALLLIDSSLPFMANRLEESDTSMLFLLQEAVTDTRMLNGYYVCGAGTAIDDEVLLGLERGTFLELSVYDEAEIHKDGKLVAKAKVLRKGDEIAVKVIEG